MFNEVREGIREDWDKYEIYPLVNFPNVDPTRYRVTREGKIAKGEYYGSEAGRPWNKKGYNGYDKKSKRLYVNLDGVDGTKVKLYCDELIIYHDYYKSKINEGIRND